MARAQKSESIPCTVTLRFKFGRDRFFRSRDESIQEHSLVLVHNGRLEEQPVIKRRDGFYEDFSWTGGAGYGQQQL